MNAAERVARMLTLVPWLLERPGASLGEIAEAFGVDEQTIRGDLEHLDTCDLPGLGGGALFEVALHGERVVVRMAEELRRPLRLTPREALHLVLRLTAVTAAFGDDIPALESALAKVREAAGVPEDVTAEVDGLPGPWLASLREAIADDRRVRLAYHGRRDTSPRTRLVDPWALQTAGGVWYLQGHDHDAADTRTFRLDRIVEVEVTDQERVRQRPAEPLPEPRYVPGPDDLWIELELDPAARWVAEAVEVAHREELEGGGVRIRFATDAPPHVARLLLAAGTAAVVLAPDSLADRVRRLADEALAAYGARPHGAP